MMKAILLGSVLALTITSTALAETIFMTAKGARQGDIRGGGTRDGAMQCLTFQSEIRLPAEATTGSATGRRQIQPVKCTRRLDRASPLFLNALTNNEALTNVTFEFSHTAPDGTEAVAYTLTLANAFVSGVRQFLEGDVVLEELTLSYQQATATFEPGITAEIRR